MRLYKDRPGDRQGRGMPQVGLLSQTPATELRRTSPSPTFEHRKIVPHFDMKERGCGSGPLGNGITHRMSGGRSPTSGFKGKRLCQKTLKNGVAGFCLFYFQKYI